MREPAEVKPKRWIIHCDVRCKHCRNIIGAENVAHYAVELPRVVNPSWFFCSMVLLDHLRDCLKNDFSEQLRATHGTDFLAHPRIGEWFGIHAVIERKLIAEQELEEC